MDTNENILSPMECLIKLACVIIYEEPENNYKETIFSAYPNMVNIIEQALQPKQISNEKAKNDLNYLYNMLNTYFKEHNEIDIHRKIAKQKYNNLIQTFSQLESKISKIEEVELKWTQKEIDYIREIATLKSKLLNIILKESD